MCGNQKRTATCGGSCWHFACARHWYMLQHALTASAQIHSTIVLRQGTGSVDAVVAFNGLASAGDGAQQYLSEVARVLKPGAPLVFIDRGEPWLCSDLVWRKRACLLQQRCQTAQFLRGGMGAQAGRATCVNQCKSV